MADTDPFRWSLPLVGSGSNIDLTAIMSRLEALESEVRRVNMFPAATAIQGSQPRPETDQSSYEELWRGDFYATGQTLHYDFFVFPNTYTMAYRIMCYELLATPTQVFEETGVTIAAQRSGTVDLTTAGMVSGTGTNPLGRYFTLRFHAKITAGGPGQVGIGIIQAPYVVKT